MSNMELVHVPRVIPPKPPVTLPSTRWVSPTDQRYSQKVPQLNNRLSRLWYTYAGGSKYIKEENQKLLDSNEESYQRVGKALLKEHSQRGGHMALGVAVGTLVTVEVIMGLKWVLNWVGQKMGERTEEMGVVRARRRRRHSRDWKVGTGGDLDI